MIEMEKQDENSPQLRCSHPPYIGTHLVCIVHCHWHHETANNGVGLYVCVHPTSDTSSMPPITHHTLSQLSIVLLVTMIGIGMVRVMYLLASTSRRWASFVHTITAPPPKPVTI